MGKAYRNLPYILLFSAFLLLGFSAGKAAFKFTGEQGEATLISRIHSSPAIKPAPTLANGQRNILVIGVDDLSSPQPRLESLWLVLYITDRPQVTLLPIYPAPPAGDLRTAAHRFSTLFKITPDRTPDPAFLDALQAIGLWWSGYIIVDEAGMAEVFDAASRMGANTPKLISGVRAVAEVPPAWDDPDASFSGQIHLAQTICKQLNNPPSSLDVSHLLDLIPRHASTDLNLTRAAAELKSLLTGPGGFTCEFPTIHVNPHSSP